MITVKGQISLFISILLIIVGLYHNISGLLILGFSILFYMLYLIVDLYSTDFSNISSKYSCKPFAYQKDKIPIKLDIDLKRNYYFVLTSYFPKYVNFFGKIDLSRKYRKFEYSFDISFTKEGRFRFPFPSVKVYDKSSIYYRNIPLQNDQMVFIKKKKPPYILDEKKAVANLNKIGSLQSQEGSGDHDFKQLREYVYGDDFRKIEWKGTARKGKLIVKESYSEALNNFFIITDVGKNMDCGKNENLLDTSVFAMECILHTLSKTRNKIGFSLFDDKVLVSNNNVNNKYLLEEFHKSLINIKAKKNSDYKKVFKEIGKQLGRRAIIVLISNLKGSMKDILESIKQISSSKHRICILYPFEPDFEKYSFTDTTENLIFDSLRTKYEDDYALLEKNLSTRNIKIYKFGPLDYEKQIIKVFNLIGKKEF